MLCLYFLFFSFLGCDIFKTVDCRADLYKVFQEDVKWAVIEKLSFLFLNFFGDGREVQ